MNKNYNVHPLPGSVPLFISSSLLPSCSRVIWPLLFPHLYFFPSPLQYYLPLHPPSSPPTPSSFFSSFPLLLSKIENRTAGNWRSLSLLGPSGFAMPLATAHLCQTIFGPLFVCFFSPSSFFFSHKLHKPFLKLDFHLRWTRSTRRVYAAFLPSIFLSLFFTSFQAVLSSISSCELSPLSPARTGAPFSSWRRFEEKKKEGLLAVGCGWLCELFGKRRNWEDLDQSDCVPDSLLRKVQDVLTSFKLLKTDNKLFLCYVTDTFSTTSLIYEMTSLHHIERHSDMFLSPLELDDKHACFWASHKEYNQGRSFYWHFHSGPKAQNYWYLIIYI